MKIKNCVYEDLYKCGVYKFTNIKTNKVYIGSTTQYFYKRWAQHLQYLKSNKHKNLKMQQDFNILNDENIFEFEIIKVIGKENISLIYELEEKLILQNLGDNCYNINPYANKPNCIGESAIKRLNSFNKTNQICRNYYNQIKNGEIQLEQIPKKYFKLVSKWLTSKAWNKGLTNKDIDYSYLKGVPKTKTDLWKKSKILNSEIARNNTKSINVYDYKGEYICTFRSIMDIVTYSKSKFHKLPLLLRNPQKRNSRKQQEGINIYELGVTNIERVCKRKCKHHKGLIFRYENDIQDIEKLTPKDIQFKRHNFKYFYFNNELLLSEEILIEKRGNIKEVLPIVNKDNIEIIYISKLI